MHFYINLLCNLRLNIVSVRRYFTTLASVTCLIDHFHLKNKKGPTNILLMMKVTGFCVGEGEDAVFLPSKKLNGLEEVQNDLTNPKQSENCL